MQFRKDINGLRAIAVIAVVLFHFNPSWLPGGFAGVDVFFVISGFLMTGIIFRGIEKDNFSILKFYIARANRIIPALAVLCLILLIFGWFYLIPIDYRNLGKHVGSSIGFLSNIIYLKESGYFDVASHEKWLLHTWSLSAEWQFYILYPLVLVIMRKFLSLRAMKIAVLLGTVLGFIYCVVATYLSPNPAYYLLSTRAWEMMLGGIAYIYPFNIQENKKKLLEWFGLVLIVGSYFLISKESPWPGYLAAFPVFGTFLLIQAQRNDSLITSNAVFQKLGAWSYSIYLWHWPLVVSIYYFSLSDNWIFIGIILSILLGFVSNRYIEGIKFKNNFDSFASYFKCIPAYMVLLVGSLGTLTFITNGFQFHYSDLVVKTNLEVSNKNPRRNECHVESGPVPECIYGTGALGAIVLGDSHAQSIVRSVEKALNGKSVLDWTKSGCRTIEGLYKERNHGRPDYSCGDFISYALKNISKYPNIPIVISNRYSFTIYGPTEISQNSRIDKTEEFYIGHDKILNRGNSYTKQSLSLIKKTICDFSKNNPVFILESIPEINTNVAKAMAKEILLNNKLTRVSIPKSEYLVRNKVINELFYDLEDSCNVNVIETYNNFCDEKKCYGDIDGRPVYFDDDHLSEFGASFLIPSFKKAL